MESTLLRLQPAKLIKNVNLCRRLSVSSSCVLNKRLTVVSSIGKKGSSLNCNTDQRSLGLQTSYPCAIETPKLSAINCIQYRYYAKRASIDKDKKNKGLKDMPNSELEQVIAADEYDALLFGVFSKLKSEFTVQLSLRTGTGIETIPVELDGEVFPIKDLAQMSRKSSNLIVLNLGALPDAIKPVEEAIINSGMNLQIQKDGSTIYVTLPKLTRDFRENLAKNAKKLFNEAKGEITEIQNSFILAAKSAKGISVDTIREASEAIRYRAKETITKCEELLKAKTKELLEE